MLLDGMLDYIANHGSQIASQTATHIMISLVSLAMATVIGVPCGYAAAGSNRSERLINAPFEMLRVVPSLALLILLIPVMGTGISPAVTALTVLAIPPILLNTSVGFRNVPDFMIESARGIGMYESEVLRKVRIPLAMPMILSGIRTALVEVFASATLAAKIGAGGLGEIIFTGLGLNRTDLLIIGGILVAVLSLTAGWLFDMSSRLIVRYKYV